METLCELGTKEKVITRGRYAGNTTVETLLIGACKYSWTFARQAEGAQPIGLKHYSGFRQMLPSIYHYFDVDPLHMLKMVMENLSGNLSMASREDQEKLKNSLESHIRELRHTEDAEQALSKIGKNLDELYHTNYASKIHEDASGNVYKRLKG